MRLMAAAGLGFALASARPPRSRSRWASAPSLIRPSPKPRASGEWQGFEIDLAKALCKQMQVECEPAPIAWDGIIPALTSGKIDMILGSMSITEERKQTVNFSDRYYYTASVFVAPKGSGLDISPEGMKGKILGVQSATTNADYAQKAYADGVEIKFYNTQDEVNADLVAGRIDAMLADQLAMDAFVKSDAGKDMEIVADGARRRGFRRRASASRCARRTPSFSPRSMPASRRCSTAANTTRSRRNISTSTSTARGAEPEETLLQGGEGGREAAG